MGSWVARALLVVALAVAACAPVASGDGALSNADRCARDGRWRGEFCERGGGGGY